MAEDCQETISGKHYFCLTHFKRIPAEIRDALLNAVKIGAGSDVLEYIEAAKESLSEEAQMTTGKSDLIDVTLEYRMENAAKTSTAFFQGKYDGAGSQKENWVWLPNSQIEIDGVKERGQTVEVTMPEWLAHNKELI